MQIPTYHSTYLEVKSQLLKVLSSAMVLRIVLIGLSGLMQQALLPTEPFPWPLQLIILTSNHEPSVVTPTH